MKKLLLPIVAALLILCGCNKTKQFTVTLDIYNADGQTVYLNKDFGLVEMCIDSAVFNDKNAVFKVICDDPQTRYILKFDKNEFCNVFPFFPENQNVTITGDYNEIYHWEATGTPAMEAYNAFSRKLLPLENATMAIVHDMEAAYAENDTVRGNELYWKAMAGMEEYNAILLEYYKQHPNDLMCQYDLNNKKRDFDPMVLKEIVETMTVESVYKKDIEKYLEEIEDFDMPMQIVE